MSTLATPVSAAPAPAPSIQIPASEPLTMANLTEALLGQNDKALVFTDDGRGIRPGYHVTEVKAGEFASLDCGANPETWRETVIQLWDIPAEAGRPPMTAGKFLAITRKVAQAVRFDPQARLTFEVSDGVAAMQLFAAMAVETEGARVTVSLASRPASCKPRDRWLDESATASQTGCGSKSAGQNESDKKPCGCK
jgi:hypothetical protein